MPNFDAWRSAIIGPLEYICRPKEKPDELLACFPFNGDLLDVSKYGCMYAAESSSFTDGGPLGKYATLKGSFVHTTTTTFSIDFFANFGNGGSYGMVMPSSTLGSGGGLYGTNNDTLLQMTNSNLYMNCGNSTWKHYALTYNGTTLKAFANGALKITATATLNLQSMITMVNATKISNLRVVGKVIGDGTTYPVPSTFYTGFEPL